MHLETVFTMLVVDALTIFPKIVDAITACSILHGDNEGDFDISLEFLRNPKSLS